MAEARPAPPGADPTAAQMQRHLRRANAVAKRVRDGGHHPFGAVLVAADHETVLLEQGNLDSVNHAEAVLARDAAQRFSPEVLWGCTLYTTVEPCCMCAGTQYWAHIGRLVYGMEERRLLALTGSDAQNPTMDLPCREVFARGQKDVRVWGPIAEVEAEIAALHIDFWQRPRVVELMAWAGTLSLAYRSEPLRGAPRTVLHDQHQGPLRVLASLYPEAPAVCHNVVLHPPGGIVGGDTLAVAATLAPGSHALVTTAGATRYYRSAGEPAAQTLVAQVADGARLEWLPLETIAHAGCIAENRMRFELAAGAEMIGWDVLALGLPASGEAFDRGSFTQQIELPGIWLERACIAAADTRLLDSPLGWAGARVLSTLWFAAGQPLAPARRDTLLELARDAAQASELHRTAGATASHAHLVVLRVLSARVEPAMHLLQQVWAGWRGMAWELPACVPRVWHT